MLEAQFIAQATTWIKHKMALSLKSHWYHIPYRKAALIKIQSAFSAVLYHKAKYSAGQMAILLKRHETLLETILPIPGNPSYINSKQALNQLITQAEIIINQYNLEE